MKKQKKYGLSFFVFLFFLLAGRFVFASLSPVITLWPLPKIYSAGDATTYYAYTDNVVYSGQWTLPPNYFAKIKYIRDGSLLAPYDTVDSFGATVTTSGSFSRDFGSTITSTWNAPSQDQTSGIHSTQIQIIADPRCVVEGSCPRCISANNPAGCQWETVQVTNTRNYNITPAPMPVLSVSPMTPAPYSVTEGSSQDQTFTVQNTGGAVMNGAVSITGGSGTFTVTGGSPYTINPGLTTIVTVRFWPLNGSGGTTYPATVTFTCSNCTPATSVAVPVTGTSVAQQPPIIGLYWGGTNNPLPGTVDFGTVSKNTSKDLLIRVKNNGASQGGTLDGGITFAPGTGQYSCPFSTACSTGCNYFGLDAGQSCDITVRFNPLVTGADNPIATFSNVVVPLGKATRFITGVGNDKPILEVTAVPPVNASCAPGTVNPTSCNITTNGTFVNVGTSKLMSFQIRNVGTNMMGGSFSVSPSSDFSCVGPCPTYAGLAPGDPPVTVALQFAPTAAGACTDPNVACSVTLTFTDKLNDNSGALISTLSFPISANGNNSPSYSTGGASINLGNATVLVGDVYTWKVMTITNMGVGDMPVSITEPATDFTCATVSDCTFTVPQGGSHDVNFKFHPVTTTGTPDAWENKTGNITVTAGTSINTYTLNGWAQLPKLWVNPTTNPVDFGVVNIGASSIKTYYLTQGYWGNWWAQNMGVGGSNDVEGTVADSSVPPHYSCVSVNGVPGCSFSIPFAVASVPQPVIIKFEPGTDVGTMNESLHFDYHSVPFPALAYTVARNVTGQGNNGPWIQVTPLGGTDYGTIDVYSFGDGKNLDFEVKNTGVGPFPLNGSVSGLGAPFTCVAGCAGYSLNPGETAIVTIRFTPTVDGLATKNITFTGAAGGSVTLSGYGNLVRNASISLAGTYDFGTVNVGDTPPVKTVTLTNNGLGNWKGEVSVELPFKCSPADGFGRCVYSVPAGGSLPVDVSFDPGAEGTYTSRAGFSGRTNPVLYFPFDKEDSLGSGVMRDASGNKTDGTLQGSANLTPVGGGMFGEAVNFTASNDVMSIPSISLAGAYAISTWFKYPLPGGYSWNTLTRGAGADHQVIVDSGQRLGVYDNASGTGFHSSGFAMNTLAGGWHHLAAVGHGTVTDFYIDGMFKGTASFKSSAQISYIGNYQGGGQPFGTIDEFEFFNRAITPTEVAKLALQSDKSKTFDKSLLAKLRRLVTETAEASHLNPPTDKISLLLNGVATNNPLINLDIGTFDFGKVKVNKFKDQTFQFANTGTGTLGPGMLSVSAPFYCLETISDLGVISPACAYSIAPGSSFQAIIRFAPTAKGIFQRDLTFSNPPGLISFPLSGEGILPFVKFLQF